MKPKTQQYATTVIYDLLFGFFISTKFDVVWKPYSARVPCSLPGVRYINLLSETETELKIELKNLKHKKFAMF